MENTNSVLEAYHKLENDENADVFVIAGATEDVVCIWKAGEH